MLKRLSVLLAVLVLFVFAGAALAQDAAPVQVGEITQRVMDRGSLICGVNQLLPGFGFPNASGEFEGFDVDAPWLPQFWAMPAL